MKCRKYEIGSSQLCSPEIRSLHHRKKEARQTTNGTTIIPLSPKFDAVPFGVVLKSAEPNSFNAVKIARLKSIMIRTLSISPSGLALSNEKSSFDLSQDLRSLTLSLSKLSKARLLEIPHNHAVQLSYLQPQFVLSQNTPGLHLAKPYNTP